MAESIHDIVRRRANSICEYCRMPQGFDELHFELDHIIPQKADGPTTPENTAWSCFRCNNAKGPNISGIDNEGDATVAVQLFHPRKQRWVEHFAWDGPELRGLTPNGRATVKKLQINLPHRVELRRMLILEGVFPPPISAADSVD